MRADRRVEPSATHLFNCQSVIKVGVAEAENVGVSSGSAEPLLGIFFTRQAGACRSQGGAHYHGGVAGGRAGVQGGG